MYTIIETPIFHAQALKAWTESEYDAFISWIAYHPLAGDVIPGADGARKVRWSVAGKGKRGGARVIYFNLLDDGEIVLLAVYVKSEQSTMAAKTVRSAKHEFKKP